MTIYGQVGDRARAVWRRLADLADASDRWFVSLSQGFSMLGGPAVVAAGRAEDPPPRVSVLPGPSLEGPPAPGAGALPVARALGALVDRHAANGYRDLAHDERFWSLVELLRMTSSPTPVDSNPLHPGA